MIFVLVAVLLVFPTVYHYQYHVLESASIFGDYLGLFSGLYYVFTALVLYRSYDAWRNKPQRTALPFAIATVLVNTEFWNLKVNIPVPISDGIVNSAYSTVVSSTGHLFGFASSYLSYYAAWPLMQIELTSLSKLGGISTDVSTVILVTVWIVIVSMLAYYFFLRVTRSNFYSMLAVFAFSVFSIHYQAYTATVPAFAFVFVFAQLFLVADVVLARRNSSRNLIGIVTLSLALGLTNFLTALMIVFVMGAVGLGFGGLPKRLFILSSVGLLVPELYNTGLSIVVSSGRAILQGSFFSQLTTYYSSKVGGSLPLWVSYVTLFWEIFFALPALAGLLLLLTRKKNLTPGSAFLCWCLVGLVPYGLLLAGGVVYITVLLVSIPVFTAPLITLVTGRRKEPVIALSLLLLVLSLPTFLAYNRNTETYKFYPQDTAMNDYLMYRFASISGSTIIPTGIEPLTFIDTNTTILNLGIPTATTPKQLWASWNATLAQLDGTRGTDVALVFSARSVLPWVSLMGITPTDSHWVQIESNLELHNRIYDNAEALIYV